ncbi:MAG: terminase gpA endonuclease subunit, partial [Candidatus Brocadiia bacterium]
RACIWAILYGHRRCVCLIGSDEGHGVKMLDTIKTELESNELLLDDFPEAVYPVQCLDGIANRCAGQLYGGKRTHIEWTAKEIVLPTIPDSRAAGAILKVAGITGRIRGMKHQTVGGDSIRPDLVILDDPQTDESARSLSQCQARESILSGAVLGLSGPGRKISGIMPCTVIKPGDMADRILDREKHPQWQGERMKMIYSFPENEKLWERYAEILASDPENYARCHERATEFYAEHRQEMDAGAEVAWAERYEEDQISGLQCAMDLKITRPAAFWAEYQNEPMADRDEETEILDADAVAAKTNGRKRGKVPVKCDHLTCFIDVQQKLLFYCVCAWEADFTGYVLDYGTYPGQNRRYFTVRDANRTLRRIHQGLGVDAAIYAGLQALTGELLRREWPRDDGAVMRIGLCLIDQGWKTDVVHQFCRQSEHAAVLMPARGHGITASQKPISEYSRRRGDRIGHHWWVPGLSRRRALRHVEIDTNYWKSFVHERLGTAMGDPGCLSIFGRKATPHRLFAEHLTAEYRVRTEGRGRTVDEWKLPAHKPDNHWFDCVVGCAAAASIQGVERVGARMKPAAEPERLKLSELQRRKR